MLELVDSLDLKSSGIYSRGGSSPPEATKNQSLIIVLNLKGEIFSFEIIVNM